MPLPEFIIRFCDWRALGYAGIVDQNVGTTTKAFVEGFEKPLDAGDIGNIANYGQDPGRKLIGYFARVLFNLFETAGSHRYLRALTGKRQGDSAANAAPAASDQCNSVFKFHCAFGFRVPSLEFGGMRFGFNG